MIAVAFEAIRLVMTQVMLSEDGQKMDPMVSLYYYAPVCAIMNSFLVWFTEMPTFKMEDFVRVGPTILVVNASVAFLLNLASLFLVSVFHPEPGGPSTNTCPDRKDKQLGADSDRHLQIYPPCCRRGVSLGLTDQLAPAIRLQFGRRGLFLLLCAIRNHTRTFGTDEERDSDNLTIVAMRFMFHSTGDLLIFDTWLLSSVGCGSRLLTLKGWAETDTRDDRHTGISRRAFITSEVSCQGDDSHKSMKSLSSGFMPSVRSSYFTPVARRRNLLRKDMRLDCLDNGRIFGEYQLCRQCVLSRIGITTYIIRKPKGAEEYSLLGIATWSAP